MPAPRRAAMAAGDFYIICPDNDVTRDTDNRRILRAAEDIIRKPPGAVTLASGLRRRPRRISHLGSAVSALTDEGGFYDRIAKARTRAHRSRGNDARLRRDGAARRAARRDISEAQAETILNAALDSGINYIDTSIDYGLSEERIGRYIGHRRDEYYLASKCGCLVGAPPAPRGDRSPHVFTPENIIAGVEQSLRRMQTDHLDVVQFHSSPSQRTLQDNGAVDALLKLKDAGKVRFIGMSGTFPNLKDHIAMGIFDVFQIPYSAVEREHEAAITAASQAGAGIVIRGGAA